MTRNIISDFVSLFFPQLCFGCEEPLARGEQVICTSCRVNLPKTNFHLSGNKDFQNRFFEIHNLNHAMAYLYFQKGGIVQSLLFAFKYKDHPEIGELLGEWYGADLKEAGVHQHFDLILPIPLHRSKLRSRGYNQSDYFARGLSKSLGVPWSDSMIVRTIRSQSQTKKSRVERWENVDGIFKVKTDILKDKRILLVDDVVTTGATLSICAKVLQDSGCREVSIASIALAQQGQ